MSTPGAARDASGLCGACHHVQRIASARGSQFSLCGRSRTDARYPRYPRLPVLVCAGYEEDTRSAQSITQRNSQSDSNSESDSGSQSNRDSQRNTEHGHNKNADN